MEGAVDTTEPSDALRAARGLALAMGDTVRKLTSRTFHSLRARRDQPERGS